PAAASGRGGGRSERRGRRRGLGHPAQAVAPVRPVWTCSRSARPLAHNGAVRISAKADYAVRATAELAAAEGRGPIKGEHIAQAQGIPLKFLLNILNELKRARIVRSQRGAEGGYQLARPAAEITLAD